MAPAHGLPVILTRRWPGLLVLALVLAPLGGCSLLSWSEPPAAHHAPTKSRPAQRPVAGPTQYTVEKGDTLYSIAFRNQLDYHDLASWNGIGRDYRIAIGQRLRLTPPPGLALPGPGGGGTTVAGGPSAPPPGPARKPVSSAPPTASSATSAPVANAPAPAGTDNDNAVADWLWPTQGEVADRFDPEGGQKGVDIAGTVGQIVVASAPGKVVYSGSALKGYGELVIVKHNETYLSAYGYNRRRLVEEGQQVTAGQPIAELGTGPEQKAELHFEIRDKGRPIDPLSMLPRR